MKQSIECRWLNSFETNNTWNRPTFNAPPVPFNCVAKVSFCAPSGKKQLLHIQRVILEFFHFLLVSYQPKNFMTFDILRSHDCYTTGVQ